MILSNQRIFVNLSIGKGSFTLETRSLQLLAEEEEILVRREVKRMEDHEIFVGGEVADFSQTPPIVFLTVREMEEVPVVHYFYRCRMISYSDVTTVTAMQFLKTS